MPGSTASNDVGQHAFVANARRGASCERPYLHSLFRRRYPPEREERRQRCDHCLGRAASSCPAQIPGTARLKHAAVTTQTLNPKVNPSSSAGLRRWAFIYRWSGVRFIRNLQNGPTQEISTASHRTTQMLIGRLRPGTSHPRPKTAQFAATFSPTNTWQVGSAFYGCLETEHIC